MENINTSFLWKEVPIYGNTSITTEKGSYGLAFLLLGILLFFGIIAIWVNTQQAVKKG